MRNVPKIGGGRGLCGGAGKRVDSRVFPGRPQNFRYQCRPVDDCSPGRGGMAQNGRTRGGTFRGKMDRWLQKKPKAELRHAVVCPNVTERTNERIAQSKRARTGSLALVDYYRHKWREPVPSGRLVCRCHDVFLWFYDYFVFLCFASFFVLFMLFSLKPRPFLQSSFDMQALR